MIPELLLGNFCVSGMLEAMVSDTLCAACIPLMNIPIRPQTYQHAMTESIRQVGELELNVRGDLHHEHGSCPGLMIAGCRLDAWETRPAKGVAAGVEGPGFRHSPWLVDPFP